MSNLNAPHFQDPDKARQYLEASGSGAPVEVDETYWGNKKPTGYFA